MGATGSSSVGAHGVYTITGSGGNKLPTTSIPTNTIVTNYPGGESATSFQLDDIATSDPTAGSFDGYNVMYSIGDQNTSGITKYYYDTAVSPAVWQEDELQVPLNSGNNIVDPYGLVAKVDPTNPAWVDLTVSGENGVYTYIDKSGDPETALSGNGVFSQLITPASYATFRGMTQDPGPVNVVWTNSTGSKAWNTSATNFSYAGGGIAFTNGENVTFDDTSTSPNVTLNTSVQPGSVTFEATNNNYSISGTGSIGGTGSLRLLPGNTSTVTLSTANTYSGGTTVSGGTLKILPSGSTTASPLGTGPLTIDGSGTVKLADNVTAGTALGTSNVNLASLSITGNGTLDIGNNRIIIDYSGAATDPISSIAAWIKNGFEDLPGPSIISSDIATADSSSGFSYGIGYADGADGEVAGLPSGEIEIMFTLVGDANLDGTVNAEDYTPFSHNIGQSGMYWDDGDFNYDGTVNAEDYTPFSHNIGQSASLAAAAGGLESAGLLESANGIASVPEPGSIALLICVAGALLARRKRNSKTPHLSADVRHDDACTLNPLRRI
jgi:autotransporter-associated beta strand protein